MTHRVDFVLFAVYLAVNIALGLWVARRKTVDARGYFLAGDRLPWYAIGGSIIAANISTEHFIGMIGVAYAVGFVVAQWEWGNWFTFSALIWIFLPYYIRGGLYPRAMDRGADGGGDARRGEGDARHVRIKRDGYHRVPGCAGG